MALSLDETKQKLDQAYDHLVGELKKLRTGRAAAGMLDGITVEVYGQAMPLQHVATVTTLDAQMLQIAPFDPNNLAAISKAIREDSSLGLNPADDGKVVRVPIPPMTSERRQEVVKQLHEKVEEANIAMRNIRREAMETIKQQKNDKDISEDEYAREEKDIAKMMDEHKTQIDELAKNKEQEIVTV